MKQKQMIKDLGTMLIAMKANCSADPIAELQTALTNNCTDKELADIRNCLQVPATVAKSGRTSSAKPNKANTPKHVPDTAVAATTPGETITVNIGPYGTEVEAKQEAAQFMNPRVFYYRSATFPLPQNFGVEVAVTSTRPIKIVNTNPLYPYGVELVMNVTGPDAKVKGWITAFKNRARLFTVK